MTKEEIPIFNSIQELFEFVVTKLWQQGRKSEVDGWCCYRTTTHDSTLYCLFGVLIPDECYDKDMEGRSVYGIVFFKDFASYLVKQPVIAVNALFLTCMQLALHDNYTGEIRSTQYLKVVEEFAARHNLDTTFLKKFCEKDTESHAQSN